MVSALPRVVVAAPASGHGKTTIATGLMAALRDGGLEVSGHKVGPDYIDPGYHALATGRPGRNLDPHLQGEERIVPLLLHGAGTPRPAHVAVIEGVMGLFDGAVGRDGFASTAHVARLVQAPVVLVVDAAAAGRSVAATVHGFATFEPGLRIGGVILNRIGSERHEAEVRTALGSVGVPVLGAIRRDPGIAVPSRHLGLVPAAERGSEAADVVARLGAIVRRSVDLDAVLALARSAPPLTGAEPWSPSASIKQSGVDQAIGGRSSNGGAASIKRSGVDQAIGGRSSIPGSIKQTATRPVLAMAGGRAFTFRYAETAELLAAAGLDVVEFDPAHDEALPDGVRALYLGGGFPEVHAAELSANEPMRRAIRNVAAAGAPVAAECAGLLYLCRELDGHPMAGVLDASARMTERLVLGYRTAHAAAGSVLADVGEVVAAHEFHRTVVEPGHGTTPAWRMSGDGDRPEGWVAGRVHASYLHLHWAGIPSAAGRLADAARRPGRRAA